MNIFLFLFVIIALQGCASVSEKNNYGFGAKPGMQEDSINNTKYNLMDSQDGSKDPNARVEIWGATY